MCYKKIHFEDGSEAVVSCTDEVRDYFNDSRRLISNAERRERYHAPYHIEATDYEGEEYADYRYSPEYVLIKREETRELEAAMAVLTTTQYRRIQMRADGLTLREIAREEGASYSSVAESIASAQKKLQKILKTPPQNA